MHTTLIRTVALALAVTAGSTGARTVIQNKGSDTLVNVAQAWAENYQTVNADVAVADSRMMAFMERLGFDTSTMTPRSVAEELTHLDRYFLVVSLDGPVKSYVSHIPFHTSALKWNVGSVDARTGDEDADRKFEAIYRDLAVRSDDLMQVLGGVGEA